MLRVFIYMFSVTRFCLMPIDLNSQPKEKGKQVCAFVFVHGVSLTRESLDIGYSRFSPE